MTSLTVTVSIGGGSSVGLFARAYVVNGANIAANQTGVTNQSDASTHPPDLPITPGTTGSWVFSATDYGPNTAPGGTITGTIDVSFSNTSIGGMIAHMGPVTGGVQIFPGGTTPTCVAGVGVIAEVLSSGTISLGTGPATFSSNTASSVTSASFTPNPGTLLVVAAGAYGGGAGTDTISISDSFGLTWRQLVVRNTSGQGVSSVWVADAPPSIFVTNPASPATHRRRRGFSRLLWRGTTVRTTNGSAPNNPPGRVPSGNTVKIPRRTRFRAFWYGRAVPPSVTTWTVERTNLPTRTRTRVTWQHTTVPTTNAQGISGFAQPRASRPVHRRTSYRAVVNQEFGSTPVVLVLQPLKAAVYRRKPSRVRFSGTIVRTTNASPSIAGTIQPSVTFPIQRRKVFRNRHRHIYGTVGIHPSGHVPVKITITRRYPARAIVRSVIGIENQHGPSGRIGKLFIPRRTTDRVIFRGTITRTVNAVHPLQVRYHFVVSRRKTSRAVWHRRLAPFIRSIPVTGKGWVSRREPARIVTQHKLVAFRYGKPLTGGIVRRRKSSRLVSQHKYGTFRLGFVITSGKAYRRPRHGVIFRSVHGQVPLFRIYVTGGKSYRSGRPPKRVTWHTQTGVVPCFIVDAELVTNWNMQLNPIFFPPPHVCA